MRKQLNLFRTLCVIDGNNGPFAYSALVLATQPDTLLKGIDLSLHQSLLELH
jgi:hypothetical protein